MMRAGASLTENRFFNNCGGKLFAKTGPILLDSNTMFAVLQKMADETFRKEHSQILLQTSDGLRKYQVAAVLKTDIQKFRFNRTEFADDADFLSFQKELFAQSLYKPETIPGADCRLLTLVTCSYEWESARTVVVAAEVR